MKTERRTTQCGFFVCSLLILGVLAAPAHAQAILWEVEMPDGILLDTYVWVPTGPGPFPTVLVRTPYGHSNTNVDVVLMSTLRQNGYATVVQESRGTDGSGGVFNLNKEEASDGHATIEWVAQQPWCDGNVAMVGQSAMGATQYAVAQGAPPALKCLRPDRSSPDRYHYIVLQGGAIRYWLVWKWLTLQGFSHLYGEIEQHRLWDSWWWDLDWIGSPSEIHVPILHMGGWYDFAQQGTLDGFHKTQHDGGAGAAGNQYLIMDPLTHRRTSGELVFPDPYPDHDQLTLEWLDYCLNDNPTAIDDWPTVRVYLMGASGEPGAPGNTWIEMDDWPPIGETRTFYLADDGTLGESMPDPGQLDLIINPDDWVQTYGGANLYSEIKYGPYDQAAHPVGRPIELRTDVLTFTTAPLTEPMEVVGRVTANIWINPDTPDLDLSVRVTDVYPDGRSMLLVDGIQRARMRESDEYEVFLTPSVREEIEVDLWSTAMVFNTGHRIRVAIAGTNYERFERNSNDGGDLNNPNYIVANPEILFGPQYPTAILLPFPALFADGFEFGDTLAWSSAVP